MVKTMKLKAFFIYLITKEKKLPVLEELMPGKTLKLSFYYYDITFSNLLVSWLLYKIF